MLRCADGSLYTGITTDVARRVDQHSAGKGAKSLRGKAPLAVVLRYPAGNRSSASQLEYAIKQLSRERKEALLGSPETVELLLNGSMHR